MSSVDRTILLQRVDPLILDRGDHFHLGYDDECFFLREYTSDQGFGYSETNQLITNLKKSPQRRGNPDWKYKGRAIAQAVADLRSALPPSAFRQTVFVPMPPSKTKVDAEYDDRMVQVVSGVCAGIGEWRELLVCRTSTVAAHRSTQRPSIDQIQSNLEIQEAYANPPPERVVLLDDVLTAGSHFKAAKRVLQARFDHCRVLGVFIARRIVSE